MKVYYNPKLKELARENRNNPTLAEKMLWKQLKGKKLKGYDFHRQKPVENFIADFYCYALRMIIEVDGSSHNEKRNYDEIRQRRLEELGFTVLRFTNDDVLNNLEGVIKSLEEWIIVFESKMN
jgi:very-short-patch-repair endonuclease